MVKKFTMGYVLDKYNMHKTISFGLILQNLGLLLFLFGAAANHVAVTQNECRMPVLIDYKIDTDRHFSFKDSSNISYYWLTDIFESTSLNVMFSIGDVLLTFGILLVVSAGVVVLRIQYKALIIKRKLNKRWSSKRKRS